MLPATILAPMEIEDPVQITVLEIMVAAGIGFIVIVTGFDLMHPVAVIVSVRVYVVLTAGITVGLDEIEEYPTGELAHE